MFSISIYFKGKLVAVFLMNTKIRLLEIIVWKCLFLPDINFQIIFLGGDLFSDSFFQCLLSLNTEKAVKFSFPSTSSKREGPLVFLYLNLSSCISGSSSFAAHLDFRLCSISSDCSNFLIIVNFCPNPQPITLSHMCVVTLFIIFLPICPGLLTQIPFLDVLALPEVFEICFLEYSCLHFENKSFHVVPREWWSFELVLQKGGFSLAWNLWFQDHKIVAYVTLKVYASFDSWSEKIPQLENPHLLLTFTDFQGEMWGLDFLVD